MTKIYAIIVTNRCNLNCRYCYAKQKENNSMGKKVAQRVCGYIKEDILLKHISDAQIIFEGNEPLLNFEIVKFIIDNLSVQFNQQINRLEFSIFSNLFGLNREVLTFISTNKINIHASLDGPEEIHDFHRGKGSYEKTAYWIKEMQNDKVHLSVSAVITRFSLLKYQEIIDAYLSLKLDSINVRYLHALGLGKTNWELLGYTVDEFISFRNKMLSYILDCNINNINFIDSKYLFIFNKLQKNIDRINSFSPPCNGITKQICIDPQGDIYTCDEGRSNPCVHKIGDVEKGIDDSKAKAFFSLVKTVEENNCKKEKCRIRNFCNPCIALNEPIGRCHTDRCKIYNYDFNLVRRLYRVEKIAKTFLSWNKKMF